jgi:hypothetical protein
MASTNVETMWVSSADQLNATVTTLVAQGGVVQNQAEGEVQVYLKKKMNVVVLVVGLILCLVPGLAYLIWYSTADQNQQITVKIGQPTSINTQHTHWYDQPAVDGASPGTVPPEIKPPASAPEVAQAPGAQAIPPTTTPLGAPIPVQDAPTVPEAAYPPPAYPPPAAPAPPAAEYPPMPPTPPAPPAPPQS